MPSRRPSPWLTMNPRSIGKASFSATLEHILPFAILPGQAFRKYFCCSKQLGTLSTIRSVMVSYGYIMGQTCT